MAKVLVLEDDRIIQYLLKDHLGEAGHQATITEDGCQGLPKLVDKDFDLVITDLRMPNMDGEEVVTIIRALREDGSIPIIAISSSREGKNEVLQAGADAFLSKPLDMKQLDAVVSDLLTGRG